MYVPPGLGGRWRLVWVTASNLDASPLLKCFIKMKSKPRDLKVLFGMGKYNYFIVLDEGRNSKDSYVSSIRKGSL